MGETAVAAQPPRYFVADKATVFFAAHLDQYFCKRLGEHLAACFEQFASTRDILDHGPEVNLLTRSVFYSASLLCHGCTPGQAFCSLRPMRSSTPRIGAGPNGSVRQPTSSETSLLLFLYVLLPYLFDRKDEIYRHCAQLVEVFRADEGVDPFNWRGVTEPQEGTDSDCDGGSCKEIPESLLVVVPRALRSCWQHIASDNSTRISRILAFLGDLHQLLYLVNGKSAEVPMTVSGLHIVGTAPPVARIKLDALAWLAGFQTSLQFYYLGRVFFNEVDSAMQPQEDSDSGVAVSECIDPGAAGDSGGRQCALCLDSMVAPAAIPCGHVFCWQCIARSCLRKQGDEIARLTNRCPVCRGEFATSSIRRLHNY